jgi:hypothetical protein
MKNLNAIKLSLITLLILSITYGCGPGKTVVKETKTKQKNVVLLEGPCEGKKFSSDDKFYRANVTYDHINRATGKALANEFAQTQISADILTIVNQVSDNYRKTVELGANQVYQARYESMARLVVEDVASSARTICEVTTQNTETKKYTFHVAREVSKGDIINKLNDKISQDEVLKIDYDYEKFKETFEKEMDKRRGNN